MSDSLGLNSLLVDHKCSKESFPTTCIHTITKHTNEVLTAAFSPNGKYLATGGKDRAVVVWNVDQV